MDDYLDLTSHFPSRGIRHPDLWADEVWPRLRSFLLEKTYRARRPVILDFAAHTTIAFAAGYCLEAKSGLGLGVLQRRQGCDPTLFKPGEGDLGERPFWVNAPDIFYDREGCDVAYGVGITRHVLPKVEAYLREHKPGVRRLVPMTAYPRPGQAAVRSGAHAMQLARDLADRIDGHSEQEWPGTVRLFIAAPNTFTFFLGQLARNFGKVQLYEYPFGEARDKNYEPSLLLTPEAM